MQLPIFKSTQWNDLQKEVALCKFRAWKLVARTLFPFKLNQMSATQKDPDSVYYLFFLSATSSFRDILPQPAILIKW